MILGLIQTGDFEPTEGSRNDFENEYLASVVWSAITKNKRTSNSNLIIMARSGRVTIAGSVRTAAVVQDITDLAASVPGVNEVVNEVSIGTIWRS
jgi:osmotically-inducible protein OsmY